jgi:putative Ca2+/H+ antiporter (TMEM165/GDT1 family)
MEAWGYGIVNAQKRPIPNFLANEKLRSAPAGRQCQHLGNRGFQGLSNRDCEGLPTGYTPPMEALLVSTGLVALAEIGDKTQLLAILLAARFGRPWPILLGIFAATLANHLLASLAGVLAGAILHGPWMRWVLGLAFLAFAAWTLIPDKFEDKDTPPVSDRSVFMTTLIAFFLVEMGDKTQVATVALAARFHSVAWVAAGTTLGMMIANAPAVLIGRAAADRLPLQAIRITAAIAFAAIGLWVLVAG